MSRYGEQLSLLQEVSGPWRWQYMCVWGHIPYTWRGKQMILRLPPLLLQNTQCHSPFSMPMQFCSSRGQGRLMEDILRCSILSKFGIIWQGMGWRAGGGVLFAHSIEEFTCRQGFVMSLMCAISFLIASNLVLSKKAQGHGLLFSCLYWLSLTHSVGMLWGILRHRQQSLLLKDQSSDSPSGPSCPFKRGLLCGLECRHLSSCFMGEL